MNRDRKLNVLLYLGKFPGYGFDVDGGSIMARQLIDTLKMKCNLSLVFIRKNHETYQDPLVKNIRYVEYKNPFGNKFERRLQNLDSNQCAIGDYNLYDLIITAHISKFFGFEDAPISFWNKTILFPMFCSSSYKRVGEIVPPIYTKYEQFIISHVKRIITPSEFELLDLQNDYDVDRRKVFVVYRGINPVFKFLPRKHDLSSPKIVYIASIKKQKNNIAALEVLFYLKTFGINAFLNLICTIQDQELYNEMVNYIEINNLTNNVQFHFRQTQEQVADIVYKSDINISVSNWETFGRGIFEGISIGLPTIVLSNLTEVKKICNGNKGVLFVKDTKNMALTIRDVIGSPYIYYEMRDALEPLVEEVSYQKERELLTKLILATKL